LQSSNTLRNSDNSLDFTYNSQKQLIVVRKHEKARSSGRPETEGEEGNLLLDKDTVDYYEADSD